MIITRTSQFSGVTRSIELNVTQEQLDAWRAGTLIQRAMPQLTNAEREFVKSGITDDEWQAMFPPEEDDEDDTDPHTAIGESPFGLPGGGSLGDK